MRRAGADAWQDEGELFSGDPCTAMQPTTAAFCRPSHLITPGLAFAWKWEFANLSSHGGLLQIIKLLGANEMHTHPAAQAVTADAPSLLLPEILELAFTLSNTAALFICCLPFAARAGAGGSRAWLSHCGTQNAATCGNGPRQRLKVGRAAQMKS